MGAPKLNPQHDGILITENLSDRDLLLLARSGGVSHIVQRTGWQPEEEERIAKAMVENPKAFLRSPLQILINDTEARAGRHFIYRCAADEKKTRVLSGLEQFLSFSSSTRRKTDTALLLMDELFTNASRNSREIAKLLSKGPGIDLPRPLVDGPQLIEAFAFAGTRQLVLGCRDSFGRLNVPALLARIETCVADGVAESIRRGTDGAGIGSFLVFNACDSYFVAVHEGRATAIGGAIALETDRSSFARDTLSEDGARPKHIHLIRIED